MFTPMNTYNEEGPPSPAATITGDPAIPVVVTAKLDSLNFDMRLSNRSVFIELQLDQK